MVRPSVYRRSELMGHQLREEVSVGARVGVVPEGDIVVEQLLVVG